MHKYSSSEHRSTSHFSFLELTFLRKLRLRGVSFKDSQYLVHNYQRKFIYEQNAKLFSSSRPHYFTDKQESTFFIGHYHIG